MILASAVTGKTITTEVTVMSSEHPLQIELDAFTSASLPAFQIRTEETQLRGPPGPSKAEVSVDPDNRLTLGTDAKLLVPDLTTDLLALYILARS